MPAMPEKQRLNRFEPECVESRRQQLESILNLLLDHPLVARQPPLAAFLKWPEDIQVSQCVRAYVCRASGRAQSAYPFLLATVHELESNYILPG